MSAAFDKWIDTILDGQCGNIPPDSYVAWNAALDAVIEEAEGPSALLHGDYFGFREAMERLRVKD